MDKKDIFDDLVSRSIEKLVLDFNVSRSTLVVRQGSYFLFEKTKAVENLLQNRDDEYANLMEYAMKKTVGIKLKEKNDHKKYFHKKTMEAEQENYSTSVVEIASKTGKIKGL